MKNITLYYTQDLDDKKLSQVLKSTTLPKVEKNECIEDYKDSYIVTDREICFGFRSGQKDACHVSFILYLIFIKSIILILLLLFLLIYLG